MKNKELKKTMEKYMICPPKDSEIQKVIATGKKEMDKYKFSDSSLFGLVKNQTSFISPWIFIVQIIFLIALSLFIINQKSELTENYSIFQLSAASSLLCVIGFPELKKSFYYNMWEIESSCKYNLSQVTLIRMAMIGSADLILLSVVSAVQSIASGVSFFDIIFYFFAPFIFLSAFNFLLISIPKTGKNGSLLLPADILIIILFFYTVDYFHLYQKEFYSFWILISAFLIIIVSVQIYRLIKKITEEDYLICN